MRATCRDAEQQRARDQRTRAAVDAVGDRFGLRHRELVLASVADRRSRVKRVRPADAAFAAASQRAVRWPQHGELSSERSGVSLAGLRELLLPLTVIACFALYYLAQLPWWSLLLFALPMTRAVRAGAGLGGALDRELRSRPGAAAVDRAARALPARYARALGMRLFAPPAVRTERHAVVAAENGLSREARASYRRALREYGAQAPLRVLLGYAHASYALGDDDEAIRVYRSLLAQTGSLPGVQRNLAHAMVRRGESLREALDVDRQRRAAHEHAGTQSRARSAARRRPRQARRTRARARTARAERRGARRARASQLRAELHRALEGAAEPRPGLATLVLPAGFAQLLQHELGDGLQRVEHADAVRRDAFEVGHVRRVELVRAAPRSAPRPAGRACCTG